MNIDTVATAIEQVESHGRWYAVSKSGCVGVMQVNPRWAKVPRDWLLIPWINRGEGKRLLSYWLRKSGNRWHYAVAAYRCGYDGLKGKCGTKYSQAVLRSAHD